ncbi:MAG: hypothetical protein P8M78_08780 [Myxococcota bacterium]|nr:hypothetical protein [Myxococcota bacterium]
MIEAGHADFSGRSRLKGAGGWANFFEEWLCADCFSVHELSMVEF